MGGGWAIARMERWVQGSGVRQPSARRLLEVQGQSRPCSRPRLRHLRHQRHLRRQCFRPALLVRHLLRLFLRPRPRLRRGRRDGHRGSRRRSCRRGM